VVLFCLGSLVVLGLQMGLECQEGPLLL